MDKPILDTVHETAKDLHAAEVMKETKLHELDALCLPSAKEYFTEQTKRMRTQENADLTKPD